MIQYKAFCRLAEPTATSSGSIGIGNVVVVAVDPVIFVLDNYSGFNIRVSDATMTTATILTKQGENARLSQFANWIFVTSRKPCSAYLVCLTATAPSYYISTRYRPARHADMD